MVYPAALADIPAMLPLLVKAASRRAAGDPALWPLTERPTEAVEQSLRRAMTAETPPFRQQWLRSAAGVTHGIHLPVPPIYAGRFGAPGLLMDDSALSPEASAEEAACLLAAAESDLTRHGAKILLAASIPGGPFETALLAADYAPLTLYLSRSGLTGVPLSGPHIATEADLPGIALRSAESRATLHAIDPFWEPHPDAAERFSAWMARSLTLGDRDMFASDAGGAGYGIAQPATPLHVPPAQDASHLGVIDDWHHADLGDPTHLADDGRGARALLSAAETALAARGRTSALVVCPAGWHSKRTVLQAAGYHVALTWYRKG